MQKLLPLNQACRVWILFVFFVCRGTAACAEDGETAGSDAGTPAVLADDPEVDRIFQYFAEDQNPQQCFQAYLWIPPATPTIRAVMVGIHNGLPVSVLQNQAIRAVCRRHGIAQIIVTEAGPVMLKDLNFDVTDPAKTVAYDRILQSLADLSGHGELVKAPIVPLAHSAYMDFPFDAAMRDPDRCLAAIPIKSGMPDKYAFYAPGGKAKSPDTRLCLRHVPILLVTSGSQETVAWRPYPIYYGWTGFETYRHDHADNPGTAYEPRNELFGACWEMMSGHFDMLPRDYRFVANWLDVVAEARLPAQPGAPLKVLRLCDGWLVDPRVPQKNAPSTNYPVPARYLDFQGDRSQALWFPVEPLAREFYEMIAAEPRRAIEMFTVLDLEGKPISLSASPLAVMPNAGQLLFAQGDGRFTLTTRHFLEPFPVDTKPQGSANLLFPGLERLPVSKLPLRFDTNSGPVECLGTEQNVDEGGVTETCFTLRLKRNRLYPDSGFQMFFPRIYQEGNAKFAAAGRTVQIAWVPQDLGRNVSEQTVTFPPLPDVPAATTTIPLAATSSAGLRVDYFVKHGPGVIRDGKFLPLEIPAGTTRPIAVTIGAYQAGVYKNPGGIKPSRTVYQTFCLTP